MRVVGGGGGGGGGGGMTTQPANVVRSFGVGLVSPGMHRLGDAACGICKRHMSDVPGVVTGGEKLVIMYTCKVAKQL
jgi:hypothetical protein